MEAYTDFASIYDIFMDDVPYEEWAERIVKLIADYDAKEKTDIEELKLESNLLLDLGCGTGVMTRLLRDKGFDCIGVDASFEMLEVAKSAEEDSSILYLCQDMRELDLYSTVGTVVSVCDCLNYLLEPEDVLKTLKLVENFLYPGGLFIFDFNTIHKYRDVIGDSTIAENRDEGSFIWENYFDEETEINEYDLTLFIRKGESDDFVRTQETHTQRGYSPATIADLVRESGLELVLTFDSDTESEVSIETERVCMVARKRK